MDLTRDVIYRGFVLNDADILDQITAAGPVGSGISGCVVDSVEPTDTDIIQFTEKRSMSDGMDAGEVFLGGRRVRMMGTLYATTRALLYDGLQALRRALSPTLAMRENPGDKGYVPMYYTVPTNDTDRYPSAAIDKRILALPKGVSYVISRDATGGSDADSLAIPWQAVFYMRDPREMSDVPVELELTGTMTGNLENRGDYHAPVNILLSVGAAAGSVVFSLGGSTFTITVPASTGARIFRYKGEDKLLTVEEESNEQLRYDLLTFQNSTTHPLISGGVSPYSVTVTGTTLETGSRLWFWESFA